MQKLVEGGTKLLLAILRNSSSVDLFSSEINVFSAIYLIVFATSIMAGNYF